MAGLLALALSGRLELAATATAAGALLILGERIMYTVNSIGDMYEAGLFVEDFTTLLATAPVTHGATGTRPAPAKFAWIAVQDVTFTNPAASTPALRGVSLQIAAGQVIALVGENGSGKTTLAKLLSRLYLPERGTITWDDTDTKEMDAADLHRRIAVIFQDFARYDLTARENIGLGAVEHIDDHDAVAAAAAHAGADHYLTALPDGYETILSPEYDGGRDLSVGRWQRVALARAFIRDAPLIRRRHHLTYATLHNPRFVEEQGLAIDQTVAVWRAGDVMPRVTAPIGVQPYGLTPVGATADLPSVRRAVGQVQPALALPHRLVQRHQRAGVLVQPRGHGRRGPRARRSVVL